QPLDEAARNEHRTLERIAPLAAELVEYSSEQAMLRTRDFHTAVGEYESAGPISRLGLARTETTLPDRRRLLIAGQPADGNWRAEQVGRAEPARAVDHVGQSSGGDAKHVAQLRIPTCARQRQE